MITKFPKYLYENVRISLIACLRCISGSYGIQMGIFTYIVTQ